MTNIMKPVCDRFYINIDAMYSDFEADAVIKWDRLAQP